MGQIASFVTSFILLETDLWGHISEALAAQSEAVSANHSALATAAAASLASADTFSVISCHASLLHKGKSEVFFEPLHGLGLAYSVWHPNLGRTAATARYPVTWAFEYDIDVHAEDTNVWVILLLWEISVVGDTK